ILLQALQLGDEGLWDDMARLLNEALTDAPDDAYLLCWLGVAERELGNDGVAYDLFRRCVMENPVDPHLLAVAGAGLAAFDDPDAEAALRAAALSGPDLPMARLQYGAYLAREGMHDEALEHLRAAVELAPDDPAMHAELGAAHAMKGDLAAAVNFLESALELAPDDSWTRVILGLVLLELGRAEEAAETLVRAAQERDDDAEALVLGALAAAAMAWDDAAEDLLAKAEYPAEGADVQLIEEAESALRSGPDGAARFLRTVIGPSALRERLTTPL
ncbi:MAG TPA: tetratricopeptide repeat protein, partial [Longimicrobiales bacterium]|nr:tetratricopeptide repeat protein [Longimicrobiales bacterium]